MASCGYVIERERQRVFFATLEAIMNEGRETTVLTGRDLDVAVARILGNQVREYQPWSAKEREDGVALVWEFAAGVAPFNQRPRFITRDCWPLRRYSTDDATALRWGVPWLNKNGWWPGFTQVRPEEDEEGTPGDWFVEVTRAEDHDDRRYMAEAKSIAAALCQVIVAVSEVK